MFHPFKKFQPLHLSFESMFRSADAVSGLDNKSLHYDKWVCMSSGNLIERPSGGQLRDLSGGKLKTVKKILFEPHIEYIHM